MSRNPLFDQNFGDLYATMAELGKAGLFENGMDALLRKPGNAQRAIEILRQEFALTNINPHKLSLDEQLEAIAKSLSVQRTCGFTFGNETDEQLINRLRETAMEWPDGRLAFRFLRNREGEGDEGVQRTFEGHAAMMKQTFDPKFWRWPKLKSDTEHLRLLNGNNTHKPVVEWMIADMGTHRDRKSITAVRDESSLADEMLAFAWQFPEYCHAIDYDQNPGLFAAGYEFEVDGHGGWSYVPIVHRSLDSDKVDLDANYASNGYSGYSVSSSLRE